MFHKVRRAARICREQGLSVFTKKAIRYGPIEVNNLFYRLQQQSPAKVMDEDWDTLIILDACRYDMFEKIYNIEGNLEHRISLGSTSEEFLERNFQGETHFDTVYVNTNPYVPYLGLDQDSFHAVVDLLDKWDEELQTVLPQTVVDAALEAHREYPDKRLIVHFMQPHAPFIGESGQHIEAKGWSPDSENSSLAGSTVWQHLRNQTDADRLDIDNVWEAYEENLEIVLKHVEELVADLDGKSVITADHGNLVGERLSPIPSRKMYGHPLGVYHPSLVKVPWFCTEWNKRRPIKEEPPRKSSTVDNELAEERLKALGYK